MDEITTVIIVIFGLLLLTVYFYANYKKEKERMKQIEEAEKFLSNRIKNYKRR